MLGGGSGGWGRALVAAEDPPLQNVPSWAGDVHEEKGGLKWERRVLRVRGCH